MTIITIALPIGLEDPNVDPATAPVWVDAEGFEYRVASGLLEPLVDEDGISAPPYETSDPIEASLDRINVVVGMDGLQALAEMGLTPLPQPGEDLTL